MLTLNAFDWPLSPILKDKFSEIIIHFHFAKAPAKACALLHQSLPWPLLSSIFVVFTSAHFICF